MNIPSRVNPFGYDNSLPSGYMLVDFLETTGPQYCVLPVGLAPTQEISAEWVMTKYATGTLYPIYSSANGAAFKCALFLNAGNDGGIRVDWGGKSYNETQHVPQEGVYYKTLQDRLGFFLNGEQKVVFSEVGQFAPSSQSYLFRYNLNVPSMPGLQLFAYSIKEGEKKIMNLTPMLDSIGIPCMFDFVTGKTFRNNGTGQFIAGFTMGQALNLADLPTPTASNALTASLPLEANLVLYNQQVESALATAAETGWNIAVQYRDEFEDDAIRDKYANCVNTNDLKTVNAQFYTDLTSDGAWVYPLPNYVGGTSDNLSKAWSNYLKKWTVSLPKVVNGRTLFYENYSLHTVETELPLMSNGQATFMNDSKLTSVKCDFPSLSTADSMFYKCILDKESVLRICSSLPTWTSGTHKITIGIHIDHKYDPDVNEALKRVDVNYEPLNLPIDEETGDYVEITEGKGWQLTVQWNGTATENAYPNPAATYSLRQQESPVYAKLATLERPDGTTENFLDWGHYVTNWEENGYQEFASVEEAEEYFNIKKETEE